MSALDRLVAWAVQSQSPSGPIRTLLRGAAACRRVLRSAGWCLAVVADRPIDDPAAKRATHTTAGCPAGLATDIAVAAQTCLRTRPRRHRTCDRLVPCAAARTRRRITASASRTSSAYPVRNPRCASTSTRPDLPRTRSTAARRVASVSARRRRAERVARPPRQHEPPPGHQHAPWSRGLRASERATRAASLAPPRLPEASGTSVGRIAPAGRLRRARACDARVVAGVPGAPSKLERLAPDQSGNPVEHRGVKLGS
jgi:hypothetical protein